MNHLYNEKKYKAIYDNWICGNTADYKAALNRLNKYQVVNFIGFLRPHNCIVIVNFPAPELQIVSL